MSLTVVMVTYNSFPLTRRLLPTLAAGVGKELQELILADSASPDKTGEKLKQEFPAITYLSMFENKGYGAAVNAGAERAKGEWLLVMNGDVEISLQQVRLLKELAEKHQADVMAPAQETPDGTLIPTVRNFPTPGNILFARRSPLGKLFGTWGGYLRPLPEKTEEIKGVVSGACFLMKKRKFLAIGGFDTNFFLFAEDTDLCRRLADSGAKIFYTPEVQVKHYWSSSAGQDYRKTLKQQQISLLRYFKKHFPGRRLARQSLRFLFSIQYYFSFALRPTK